ncbi:putative glycerol-3-phosphate 1-O-acyltransferase [Helianthus annuus]|nr:putative glycerol-3-phosphate 1-O-acyltransferase [Helianthus annuus]KAJ0752679.1 putative glycerol-3-phosphate 1-O-acyltransferase [Helianthus annuus]
MSKVVRRVLLILQTKIIVQPSFNLFISETIFQNDNSYSNQSCKRWAASGGRDRPDLITNHWSLAPFDAVVDNMRRLVEHAGVPGHVYPLSLLCYDIMPPTPQVEIEIGERRVISFHGAGLSVAHKIDFNEITASCGDPDEAKEAYSRALYDSVRRQYNVLKTAIHGAQGLDE